MTKFSQMNFSKVSLYISSACNLSCSYCYVEKNRKNLCAPAKMSYEIIRRSIDLLPLDNNQHRVVHFVGGEPLMNWNGIREAVNYAKKRVKNVKFTITTNGTLLTEQKARFLIQNNFDVFISVDSHIAGIHNILRPSLRLGPTFRSTMRAFGLFRDYKNIYAHITWTRYNSGSLLDSLAFFEKKGVGVVIGTIMLPEGGVGRKLRPLSKNYSEVFKAYIKHCKRIRLFNTFAPLTNIIKAIGNENKSKDKDIVCGGATTSIAVSANGDIYPCPSLVGIDRFKLGSVENAVSYTAREEFMSLQRKRKCSLPCKRCSLVDLCNGGCTALCYHNQADPVRTDPLFCSYFRNLVGTAKKLCKINQ